MTLREDALLRAHQFMHGLPELRTLADGTWREMVAINFAHLSVEHHSGIVVLVQEEQYSPAFALFRPQMEAWLRALWARWIAAEDRLRAFIEGDASINPKPRHIITQLPNDEEREALLQQYDQSWSHLCDFTHGGALQIQARMQEHGVQTFFADDTIRGLVDASPTMAYLTVLEMSELMKAPELTTEVQQLYASLYHSPRRSSP